VFRKRNGEDGGGYSNARPSRDDFLFVAACWLVVINTIYKYPANSLIGLAIMLAGIPVYFLWRRK
jgi:APA family basic amino acid/polyamine antiporter